MQADDGGSVYLRLSTRALEQPDRTLTDAQTADLLAGAYWQVEPAPGAELAIVYSGPVVSEVQQAFAELVEDVPGLGILAVPSNDRLYHDWQRRLRNSNGGGVGTSHVGRLVSGHPAALSWIGSATGRRLYPLGVASFGQSGDIPDLYRHYGIDAAAIVDMAATACLEAARG